MKTAEQRARDMLERCGVPDAQGYSSGDLVELANTIAALRRLVALKSLQDRALYYERAANAYRRVADQWDDAWATAKALPIVK